MTCSKKSNHQKESVCFLWVYQVLFFFQLKIELKNRARHADTLFLASLSVSSDLLCVCVCERESIREAERNRGVRETEREGIFPLTFCLLFFLLFIAAGAAECHLLSHNWSRSQLGRRGCVEGTGGHACVLPARFRVRFIAPQK